MDALDAGHAQARRPQVLTGAPGGLRQLAVAFARLAVRVVEPAPGLDHGDPVPLLGEAQRGDAAAEPRADHDHVVVRTGVAHPGTYLRRRRFMAFILRLSIAAYFSYDMRPTGSKPN